MWWVLKIPLGKINIIPVFLLCFLWKNRKTEGIVLWQQPADNEARVKYVVCHLFEKSRAAIYSWCDVSVRCAYIRRGCQLKRWSLITERYVFQCGFIPPELESREMSNINTTTLELNMQHAQKWKDIELSRERETERMRNIHKIHKDTSTFTLNSIHYIRFLQIIFIKQFNESNQETRERKKRIHKKINCMEIFLTQQSYGQWTQILSTLFFCVCCNYLLNVHKNSYSIRW